ncbi:DivIVA domain-containing protein [Anaerotalea alkaliphila]|uniref:DivIVA domain-containing protein n=1 Tax=Anaerotalea alkaliphila TaxID=2662126 RepID=A0A7X5HWG7_9FIRM|nr:DivIVA domain-containing protein [Anaerotalea alkaliphila]NDL67935.1 DivIVA domain-containing protein [Anaerotalea alkaliphila]
MLTPLDIESKQFSKAAVGGYNVSEVRKFMREILNSYEKAYKENIEMRDKVNILNEGIQYYKTLEETLQNTLIMAEKMAEETKQSARTKAELMEKEAEANARKIVADAKAEVLQLQQMVDGLKKNYEVSKIQIQQFLKIQMEMIQNDSFLTGIQAEEKPNDEPLPTDMDTLSWNLEEPLENLDD